VVEACPPVAWGFQELLLGDEMSAITALELLFLDFVVACVPEIGKLLVHRVSSMGAV
jgi:hypothetical protein